MPSNTSFQQQRATVFQEACRAAGVKVTPQRMAIYEAIASSTAHPPVEDVWEEIRLRMPRVSLDTVYRAFRLFEEMGLVFRIETGEGRVRFDGNCDPHHHFICTKCGMVFDFWSQEIDGMSLPKSVQLCGRVDVVRVEVKGMCHQCLSELEGARLVEKVLAPSKRK